MDIYNIYNVVRWRKSYHIENNLQWGWILWCICRHKWLWLLGTAVETLHTGNGVASWRSWLLDCVNPRIEAGLIWTHFSQTSRWFLVNNQSGPCYGPKNSWLLGYTVSDNLTKETERDKVKYDDQYLVL